MTTEKRRAANARNAKKGGVKTASGKAVVRFNAVTHGLTSKHVLLRDEDATEFNALRDRLMAELAPCGEIETLFADIFVSDTWRLKRAMMLETDLLQGSFDWYEAASQRRGPLQLTADQYHMAIDKITAKQFVTNDAADSQWLMNIERYRTAIERHLLRWLRELRGLQNDRLFRSGSMARVPAQTESEAIGEGGTSNERV